VVSILNYLGVPLLRRVATLRVSLRSWLRHRFAALQAAHAKTYCPRPNGGRSVSLSIVTCPQILPIVKFFSVGTGRDLSPRHSDEIKCRRHDLFGTVERSPRWGFAWGGARRFYQKVAPMGLCEWGVGILVSTARASTRDAPTCKK
jgi:hypothetical protein